MHSGERIGAMVRLRRRHVGGRPAGVPLLIWSSGERATVGLPIGVAGERAASDSRIG
jgi:hypothetical protein